jgi:predicted oxidoreductase
VTSKSSRGIFLVPSLTVKYIGKNAATEAIIIAAESPGPNHKTSKGRKDRSGRAPNNITSGVRVTSNGFLLPATKAVGRAIEKANTSPKIRLMKL